MQGTTQTEEPAQLPSLTISPFLDLLSDHHYKIVLITNFKFLWSMQPKSKVNCLLFFLYLGWPSGEMSGLWTLRSPWGHEFDCPFVSEGALFTLPSAQLLLIIQAWQWNKINSYWILYHLNIYNILKALFLGFSEILFRGVHNHSRWSVGFLLNGGTTPKRKL